RRGAECGIRGLLAFGLLAIFRGPVLLAVSFTVAEDGAHQASRQAMPIVSASRRGCCLTGAGIIKTDRGSAGRRGPLSRRKVVRQPTRASKSPVQCGAMKRSCSFGAR